MFHRAATPGLVSEAERTGSMARPRRDVGSAAALGGVGGLLLFLDLALHAFGSIGRGYFAVAALMAVCLPFVSLAYWLRGAIRAGWTRVAAAFGTLLVGLGALAWIAAFALLFYRPELAFTQRLTPGGSALMSLGMILYGIAVLGSRRLTGRRAALPLLVGLYFPLQLIAQLMFFLGGKDGLPGPNGVLLGSWGLVWAAAAWGGVTARRRVHR